MSAPEPKARARDALGPWSNVRLTSGHHYRTDMGFPRCALSVADFSRSDHGPVLVMSCVTVTSVNPRVRRPVMIAGRAWAVSGAVLPPVRCMPTMAPLWAPCRTSWTMASTERP